METTLTLPDFLALIVPLYGAIFLHMRALRADMNRRFDDAQADVNRRFDDAQANVNQRFDDAQKANDLAHAHIGDNIKNLERRVDSLERHVDSGLGNVHMQLAALTPRAAAAAEPPDAARTPRP